MQFFTHDDLTALVRESRASARKRKMRILHEYPDVVQRMFNAVQPQAYFRPHKHEKPDKTETMLVVRGAAGAFTFDDEGNIVASCMIGPEHEIIAVDFEPRVWHTICVFEADTIIFEAKQGPYDPKTDKKFASWAPGEDAPEASDYLEMLKGSLVNPGD